jgi:hypothetical protein
MKGFFENWCQWIHQFVNKGSVGIKVNDDVGLYFQTKKGLRQGDMLALLISRAKENGQINCLVPQLVEGGLSIL